MSFSMKNQHLACIIEDFFFLTQQEMSEKFLRIQDEILTSKDVFYLLINIENYFIKLRKFRWRVLQILTSSNDDNGSNLIMMFTGSD